MGQQAVGGQCSGGGRWARVLVLAASVLLPAAACAQQVLTVAAYPAVDKIVEAAIPAWKKRHPNVGIKVVSRQFADHHTAMTTALSTSFYLPDVMALEVGYVGRFAQGGGLEDLRKPPFDIGQVSSAWVPYAVAQATSRSGANVAAPADIGPGTLLWRADVLAKAGVGEAELTKSWDSYVAAGVKIKQTTGAYLLPHARDMKDIVIRTGIQPGEGCTSTRQHACSSPARASCAPSSWRAKCGATSWTHGSWSGRTSGAKVSSAAPWPRR